MNAIVRQTLTLTLTKLRVLLDISCLIALFNWRSKTNENQVIAAFSRFNRPHQRSLHFAFGNPRKFGGKIRMTSDIIALQQTSRFLKTQKTFFPQNGKVAPLTFVFTLFFGHFLQKHILLTMLNSLLSYLTSPDNFWHKVYLLSCQVPFHVLAVGLVATWTAFSVKWPWNLKMLAAAASFSWTLVQIWASNKPLGIVVRRNHERGQHKTIKGIHKMARHLFNQVHPRSTRECIQHT